MNLVFNVARARKYFRMVEEIIIRSKAALSRLGTLTYSKYPNIKHLKLPSFTLNQNAC